MITWKNCFRVGISAFLLFLAIYYWSAVSVFLGTLINATLPIVIGLAIAYVLNILMSFYERHYFNKFQHKKFFAKSKRPVCLVGAIVTLIGILALIIYLVVPELVECVKFLMAEIPPMIEEFLKKHWVKDFLPENTIAKLRAINWMQYISEALQKISSGLGDAVSVVASAVSSFVSTVVTIFISIIFSIYLLYGKNHLQDRSKLVLKRYMPDKWNKIIRKVFTVFNECFHKFIVGQCTEAVILGILCAVTMLIFRFPYAGMIGTLIGFTALIPIVGAYVGAAVGAIMMLTVSPAKAFWFLVLIIIIQQIEGNIIYPKVVGNSIGLPAMWVLAAITIGSALMGVLGMLLGVPVAAAIYKLLREDVIKGSDKNYDSVIEEIVEEVKE